MKRTLFDGINLPVWPTGKKMSGNYWRCDPVKQPKSVANVDVAGNGVIRPWTVTPAPADLTPDEMRAWLWHADKFGPSRQASADTVRSLRVKMGISTPCKRKRTTELVAVSAEIVAPVEILPVAAPVERSAIERRSVRVPQLPAMAGMAPLGMKQFRDDVTALQSAAVCTAPQVSAIATLEKRIMATRKPFEGDTVSVPNIARVTPASNPAPMPRVKSKLESIAVSADKSETSGKVPIVASTCTDARIAEIKRLEALAEQVNADLKSARALVFPELERARIDYARSTKAFLSSIHPEGLAHKTFTSRHSHNSTMSTVEVDAFHAAAESLGIDGSKYILPVYTVDCECGDFGSMDTVLQLLEHGGRITVELPRTAPDSLVDALVSTLPKDSIVASVKTAKILHHDYTMDPAVESLVNKCSGMKAVQPVTYFAK